jgi:uncharacterized membrane protein
LADNIGIRHRAAVHPVQAILLASTIPLFLGALLSDWAYAESYQIQWTNFSSWLVAGGLVFAGLALAWAIVDALRSDIRGQRTWLYPALILATFVVGFFNALVHAKDAWAAMPEGFILSAVVLLLAIAANWAAHSQVRTGDRQ